MKHEIEIEGLPEGWEAAAFRVPLADEWCIDKHGNLMQTMGLLDAPRLIVRRKVRKYDWSKTLDDVLVEFENLPGYPQYQQSKLATFDRKRLPDDIWQPNIHGTCPVHGEAAIVRVKDIDSIEYEDIAEAIDWDLKNAYCWQFVRLADGYEW